MKRLLPIAMLLLLSTFGKAGGADTQSQSGVPKSQTLPERRASLITEYQHLSHQVSEGQANLLRLEGAIKILDLAINDSVTTDSEATTTSKKVTP